MIITIKDDTDRNKLKAMLDREIRASRFTCRFEIKLNKMIKLKDIRLKEKKRYCGNHPNACDIEGGRMGIYLEGADWVEFNDRVNDVLDELYCEAHVYTSVCKIRLGKRRRINYESDDWPDNANLYVWQKVGDEIYDYENYCGRIAPASTYPIGTPGLYERI